MFVGFAYWLYHPWFVCTQPNAEGLVVVVSATDATKCLDQTCLVSAGAHEMITKDSAMYYDDAQFISVENLEKMKKHGTLKPRAKADDELMVRVRQGAIDSFHTPNDVRAAIRRCPWKPKKAEDSAGG